MEMVKTRKYSYLTLKPKKKEKLYLEQKEKAVYWLFQSGVNQSK
jgi:hypothetical protein